VVEQFATAASYAAFGHAVLPRAAQCREELHDCGGNLKPGSTAGELWKLLDQPRVLEAATNCDTANILSDVRV
jgi:hypothetical protein